MIYLHILFGMLSLLLGPLALISRKGSVNHKRFGIIFFWSMTIVTISALILGFVKFNPFLLLIAVFSYYSIFSGYRAIHQNNVKTQNPVKTIDWMAMSINAFCNFCFVLWGLFQSIYGNWGFFAYLAIGFGLIGLNMSRENWKRFKSSARNTKWISVHIGNMLGGYIATLTAFSATVMTFLPPLIAWIWPSLVGIPLIYYWTRNQRLLVTKR